MTEKRIITLCHRSRRVGTGIHFVQLCLFVVNILFSLNSCEKEPGLQKVKSTSFSMGTVVEITVLDTSDSAANKAIEELHAGFHQTSIIESSKGTVLIRDIIDEIMLCCYIPKPQQERQVRIRTYLLGVALSTMERVATKIRKYLVSLKSPYDD